MFTATRISVSDLKDKRRKVIRRDGKQILLIAHEGGIYAIANRCPHEGYPLSEGTEGPGCVLTCNWHNWKFDLQTGEALVGRDPLRTYPVHIAGGEIHLDLSDPTAGELRARALKGLEAAVQDVDMPRIAREVARLERAGFDARDAMIHAIVFRNAHLEDGMTHAYGAAADWLLLSENASTPEKRLLALIEPIYHLAWDTQGADSFPYADGVRDWDANGFVSAVEAEREADAITFVRGAVRDGIAYADLMPVFGATALAHYADFGHSAIYAVNTGTLIERLGEEAKLPLLLALTRSIVRATREERLPEFRFYDKALLRWSGGGGDVPITASDLVLLSIDGILERVLQSARRPNAELFDALMGAAAWNLMHFDLAVDQVSDNAIADNVSWLDFSHALTFASAARQICGVRANLRPRALLQMALFVGRNTKYVRETSDEARWEVKDRDAFLARETEALYDHGSPEPIIACHRVKMIGALKTELAAAPDAPWADAMCAGVNRFLNSPIKRHHGLRTASQALDFVTKEA
ncbi:MAG: Rieske 2Fe-2S domain-containing protein [Alphaproteobacteria bacterium]|nr:Rieske 2Fe-2S domain-containing protein [Alphaproteobacteria bacterium]